VEKTEPHRTRLLTLLTTGISSFVTPFMSSSINIALPAIGKHLNLDAIGIGWLATSSLLSSAMLLLPFGRLADLFSRRRFFATGLAIYTLASLAATLANSATILLLARILQGIAGAMIFSTGVAILTAAYPRATRGWALGINTAATYFGLSIGPFLGGILTRYLGWRAVFGINLPFSIAALLMTPLLTGTEPEPRPAEKFDLTGSAIYAAGVFSLMFGLSQIPARSAILLIPTAILTLFAFFFWEHRTKNPIFNFRLFGSNRVFAFSNLAALINYSATAAVSFLLSLYLQYLRRLSVTDTGMALVSQPVVMALFSPFAGRLSDRIEPRLIASFGMALTALGLFLFALLTPTTPLLVVILGLVLVGFGFALFSAPNTSAVMGAIAARDYSIGSATLATMRLLGQTFSLGIAMMLLSIFVGQTKLTAGVADRLMPVMRTGFITFSILCLFGVFASLARGRRENH
jgi:EmrB/QacA subfamily drug resistance transporter